MKMPLALQLLLEVAWDYGYGLGSSRKENAPHFYYWALHCSCRILRTFLRSLPRCHRLLIGARIKAGLACGTSNGKPV